MKRLWGLVRRASVDPAHADPRGPIFISYRRSDGLDLAISIASALRSNGVPVWHDIGDIPRATPRGASVKR
jgi:hypothetical protein